LEASVVIVGGDPAPVERDLKAGKLACPNCGGELRPHGVTVWAARRRRSRCKACGSSHVLTPDGRLFRRRDPAGVILAALIDKASGLGYRKIAERYGLSDFPTRVRGWTHSFAANAEQVRVHMTAWAAYLDSNLTAADPRGSVLGDALEAIGLAARAASLRLSPREPAAWASRLSGGYLLCPNTRMPLPQAA
jgi:hypothetical protein